MSQREEHFVGRGFFAEGLFGLEVFLADDEEVFVALVEQAFLVAEFFHEVAFFFLLFAHEGDFLEDGLEVCLVFVLLLELLDLGGQQLFLVLELRDLFLEVRGVRVFLLVFEELVVFLELFDQVEVVRVALLHLFVGHVLGWHLDRHQELAQVRALDQVVEVREAEVEDRVQHFLIAVHELLDDFFVELARVVQDAQELDEALEGLLGAFFLELHVVLLVELGEDAVDQLERVVGVELVEGDQREVHLERLAVEHHHDLAQLLCADVELEPGLGGGVVLGLRSVGGCLGHCDWRGFIFLMRGGRRRRAGLSRGRGKRKKRRVRTVRCHRESKWDSKVHHSASRSVSCCRGRCRFAINSARLTLWGISLQSQFTESLFSGL